ncbi:hypothetical protein M9Y10_036312 [Tritrichomonas musculus]|uniref:mitogen-activated protein kinase kinase n=1 Tax=Tritrichomonas musculus TaxID=1915356 RepID=A0ABR2GLZ9_9EUKA
MSNRKGFLRNLPNIKPEVQPEFSEPSTEDLGTTGLPAVKLSDIELGDSLGRGASGSVEVAKLKTTNNTYALKKIQYRESKENIKQVVNELHLLNKLHHPNIVQFYTAFYSGGFVYILMELIQGGSLNDLLQISPQVPEDALGGLAYQCLQGLFHLRKNHIIHRDLKPSNILITQKGEVKIADFGMSKQLEQSTDKVQSFLGTMCYMSPERLREEKYGFLSDIWSFGIIIYQCAAGKYPLIDIKNPKNTNVWSLIGQLTNDVTVQLPPQYSPEIVDFISGCLRIDPQERTAVDILLNHPWVQKYTKPEDQEPFIKWSGVIQAKIAEKKKETLDSLKDFK